MRNYKFWTPEEDLVIRDLVATHGSGGIKIAAKQLNRTFESVRKHIYRVSVKNGDYVKTRFPITEKEIKIRKKTIEKYIKDNPGNISKALVDAAEELNLSPNTLKLYYYHKTSTLYKSNLNPCFAVIGKSYTTNSKIFTTKRTTKSKLIENIKHLISKLWK